MNGVLLGVYICWFWLRGFGTFKIGLVSVIVCGDVYCMQFIKVIIGGLVVWFFLMSFVMFGEF